MDAMKDDSLEESINSDILGEVAIKRDILEAAAIKEDALERDIGLYLNGMKRNITDISDVIGGHGPWQFRHWIVFFAATACNSTHFFSTLSLSSTSPWNCSNLTDIKNGHILLHNSTTNCSIPDVLDHRFANDALSADDIVPCVASLGDKFQTAHQDVSCGNAWVITYAKCVYVIGCMLSGLILRPLILRFGRRPVSLSSCLMSLFTSLATSWAKTPATYLILRLFTSIGIMNIYLISAFSMMECVYEEYRLLYGLTAYLAWGMAHFLLPLAMWLASDWTRFNIVLSLSCLLLLLLLCFLPESPLTYAAKGDWSRARRSLRLAAASNGYSAGEIDCFTRNLVLQSENRDSKNPSMLWSNSSCLEVFKVGLSFVGIFMVTFLYFSSVWLTEGFKGIVGTYFALIGTAEVSSVIILLFLTCFISIQHLWSLTSVMAAILLLVMYSKASNDIVIFRSFSYITCVFFTSAAWTLVLLRTLNQPFNFASSKWNAVISGSAIALGSFTSALLDMQKFHEWGAKPLLIWGISHLIIGASVVFISEKNPRKNSHRQFS